MSKIWRKLDAIINISVQIWLMWKNTIVLSIVCVRLVKNELWGRTLVRAWGYLWGGMLVRFRLPDYLHVDLPVAWHVMGGFRLWRSADLLSVGARHSICGEARSRIWLTIFLWGGMLVWAWHTICGYPSERSSRVDPRWLATAGGLSGLAGDPRVASLVIGCQTNLTVWHLGLFITRNRILLKSLTNYRHDLYATRSDRCLSKSRVRDTFHRFGTWSKFGNLFLLVTI